MIENWAYAALAEHIYRRNQSTDQAILEIDLQNKGGLINAPGVLFDFGPQNANLIPELTARGFFISEDRYIYNPATGFEATIAQGAAGEFVIVFRGTDLILPLFNDDGDDLKNDFMLGRATDLKFNVDDSQWVDVKNLMAFALTTLAPGRSDLVSVTGQSLGGMRGKKFVHHTDGELP
ncbi:MAG: hypothetical protein AAB227_01320 [Pseudomonadota bacterium]